MHAAPTLCLRMWALGRGDFCAQKCAPHSPRSSGAVAPLRHPPVTVRAARTKCATICAHQHKSQQATTTVVCRAPVAVCTAHVADRMSDATAVLRLGAEHPPAAAAVTKGTVTKGTVTGGALPMRTPSASRATSLLYRYGMTGNLAVAAALGGAKRPSSGTISPAAAGPGSTAPAPLPETAAAAAALPPPPPLHASMDALSPQPRAKRQKCIPPAFHDEVRTVVDDPMPPGARVGESTTNARHATTGTPPLPTAIPLTCAEAEWSFTDACSGASAGEGASGGARASPPCDGVTAASCVRVPG